MIELQQDINAIAPMLSKRICIITADIFGPIKNGGIGTAYFHLAVFLKRTGHHVTICFVNGHAKNQQKMRITRDFYSEHGIEFSAVAPQVLAKTEMAQTMAPPYAAYEWLREHESHFDMVHVSEWRGLGYVALLAKKLGIAFLNLQFVVKGSSPTLWAAEGNSQFLEEYRQLGWVFMERQSVEMADTLICGSQHLLNWMLRNCYKLPAKSFYWPNVFLEDLSSVTPKRCSLVGEWVFFGRLEPRKGILLFVNALNALAAKGISIPPITFLGGYSHRFDAQKFIMQNSKKWQTKVTFKVNCNAFQAIEYLSVEGRLAVIPSLLENSPLAVYECLAAQVPFIAANTGGTYELIDEDGREGVLFEPHHLALAGRLEHYTKRLPAPAVRHDRLKRSLTVWENWHRQNQSMSKAARPKKDNHPLVSICLTHFERPHLLTQALKSIERQTYRNFEVIVVDDGSRSPLARATLKALAQRYKDKSWRILYQENRYVGAARNKAAQVAKGEFLLFFDDDNFMMPEMVDKLVSAATFAGLDCLTCSSLRFSGEGEPYSSNSVLGTQIRFVGPAKAWATKVNVVGDATCLVKKTAFSASGGYSEGYRVGKDDIEFYNRLILDNRKISYYPDPLYYYRQSTDSMKLKNQIKEEADFKQVLPFLDNMDAEDKSLFLLRPDASQLISNQRDAEKASFRPGKVSSAIRKAQNFIRVKI
ncbi:putative glycosyltransferase EpsH [Pseudovibrio sp. Ad46]|uniref:glycosyltransferase n=1 Tax=unclassified Pseudovibrio TaxID=2627060 RepID=UPI0007AEA25C|nr:MULTISPECIES: glycosyltransferase [unclassified Pseudovibrio]KZK84480.1 putative glycosyltransferase EpsH [Pseudovibrio sp. Ad46]KZK92603.1 putative glycosyltransferase EpsH [Pseudovibrio sp. W74]KZL10356.1 putative glycosyltransferase EpsH [Pseudovibrio sp. Ad14]KZL22965.1 putative glycosyltransferase EpsH [Pseudovibrio sp. WM33]